MTVFYILLRYGGLLFALSVALNGVTIFATFTVLPCSIFWKLVVSIQMVLIIVLEGVITLRVYALYLRKRLVTYLLLGVYIMSQVGNILSLVDSIISSRQITQASGEAALRSGQLLCDWRYDSSSTDFLLFIATTLIFETTAFVLAVSCLITHLRDRQQTLGSVWRSNNLFYLVARENLAYFCISTAAIIANATGTISNEQAKDAVELRLVLTNFWLSLFGPYLVLSVRKHEADRWRERSTLSSTVPLSTLAFADRLRGNTSGV